MTAPDPRLDEIQARLSAATPGPWAFDGTEIDTAPDIAYLLAELRKAREALGRVDAKCLDLEAAYKRHPKQPFEFGLSEAAAEVRAAVAAAKGDERG